MHTMFEKLALLERKERILQKWPVKMCYSINGTVPIRVYYTLLKYIDLDA
jgi:hypothetical protein